MTKSSYLQKLKQRRQLAHLKEQIVFGFTLGWLLTLVGGFHYLFVSSINYVFWQTLFYLGIGLVSLSIILSAAISILQKPLQTLTQKIRAISF